MKKPAMLFAVALFAVFSSRAYAGGGLLQSLPKDGSWTKYLMEMKSEAPAGREMSATFTIKSVGAGTEDGKKCRWIEIDVQGEQNGKQRHEIMKMLVNEKYLKPGSKEAPEIIRGWKSKGDKGEVKELSDRERNPNGKMAMFFGGRRKDVKKLKKTKVVDYQKGKLKLTEGTTGKFEPEEPNAPKGYKFDVTQSVWTHKSVPFGTAAMEIHMVVKVKDKVRQDMTIKFTLVDHGKGAKSGLPDKN